MEAVNEASKNVAKSRELLKRYLEDSKADGAAENETLAAALDLLDKTLDILTKH